MVIQICVAKNVQIADHSELLLGNRFYCPKGRLPPFHCGSSRRRPGVGGGSGGRRGRSGPSRARIARFGRMSQRFSTGCGRLPGGLAEKSHSQGMGCRSRVISLSKPRGPFYDAALVLPQFTPETPQSP